MRDKILIADDTEMNRAMLSVVLGDHYKIVQASDGQEAIELIDKLKDELLAVLLALDMSGADGLDVLGHIKETGLLEKAPVIIISSESTYETEREYLEKGVSDFIRKPFDNVIVKSRVDNLVDLFTYRNNLEEKVQMQTQNLQRQNKLLELQAEKIKKSNEMIIDVLGTVVEYRNLERGAHIKRVKGFTNILATKAAEKYHEYGLTPQKIEVIVAASALHDIGKIAIKDSVLLKPGKLTHDEFEYMQSHTIKGCDILDQINEAWDKEYAKASWDISRYHHERYDGNGYPEGLSGEDIPISAQLVSIADVYDALVSKRIYKDAIEKEKAYHMILMGECGVFSPKLMQCLRECREQFEELADKYDRLEVID